MPPDPGDETDHRFEALAARAVAWLYGVTVQALDGWVRNGCPVERRHGRLLFDLRAVIAWRRERDIATAKTQPTPSPGSLDSEAELARMRRAKADLAELDLAERRGELLSRSQLLDQWRHAGSVLRQSFEAIERAHGREVGDAIRQALDDAHRHLDI